MLIDCERCGRSLVMGASYCGHCGSPRSRAMEMARPRRPEITALACQPLPPPPAPLDPVTAAHLHLETTTRLNPLMNQERIKAMVMGIAAQGGTGTVGYWSDC